MQTSDENIYAIGDVALRREQSIAVESVHNAQESAAIAAAAIAGERLMPALHATIVCFPAARRPTTVWTANFRVLSELPSLSTSGIRQ